MVTKTFVPGREWREAEKSIERASTYSDSAAPECHITAPAVLLVA